MSQRFDSQAPTWDAESRRVRLAEAVTAAILEAVPVEPNWRALDFGCGTGLVTLALAPRVAGITGADASEGMLRELARKVEDQGLAQVEVLQVAATGPLALNGPFDLITSSMTLHHVEHPVTRLDELRRHLRPGGWLALADLAAEDGRFHDELTGVFHLGFAPETLQAHLHAAGYREIQVRLATTVLKGDRTYDVLLATGRA